VEIGFAPRDVEGLQHASVEDLRAIEVEALGLGIHFPTIDADLHVPALLKGILGSRRWMTALLRSSSRRPHRSAEAVRAKP
jgi:hypothetical protein